MTYQEMNEEFWIDHWIIIYQDYDENIKDRN